MLKVVLDTNVFVSSLLVNWGLPAQVVNAWRQRYFLLIVSPAILREIGSTLSYPRIRRKYRISDEDVAQLIELLEKDALVVPGEARIAGAIPEDPTDEMVLRCSVEAGADLIVSGDRHLLDLGMYRGIPVLTVREFTERLEGSP